MLTLRAERETLRAGRACPDVKNYDGLNQSGSGCFIAERVWQQWMSKG